jgi:hypothetical protein
MAKFTKGNKGKPKGATNKINKSIKQTMFDVFSQLQDDPKANLLSWAKDNQTEFYRMSIRLIQAEGATVTKKNLPEWLNEEDEPKLPPFMISFKNAE